MYLACFRSYNNKKTFLNQTVKNLQFIKNNPDKRDRELKQNISCLFSLFNHVYAYVFLCGFSPTKVQVRPAFQAAGVMGRTRCVGAGSWASAWAGPVSSICRAISPALETYSSLRTHHCPSVVLHFCPTQMQLSMLPYHLLTSQAEPTTALQNSTALINSTTPLRVTELSTVIISKPYRFIYDLQLNQGYSWVTLSFGLTKL